LNIVQDFLAHRNDAGAAAIEAIEAKIKTPPVQAAFFVAGICWI
jgi:hypothetical protein